MPIIPCWCTLNPQCKDAPVHLRADNAIVEATAFLGWLPSTPLAGVARVSLAQFQMLRAFISRCGIPRGGQDEAAAADISVLAMRLSATTWARILTELEASGLATALNAAVAGGQRATPYLLQQCLDQLIPLNPGELLLHAADFAAAGEEFDAAAVAGHGRGRGRGAAGAPGVQGPAKLRFLGLVTALDLEEEGATAPLFLLARVSGMLGACLTRASRLDERSTVAVLGEMLRTQLLARGGGAEYGALADAVASYLRSITIPDLFCAGAAGIDDLRIEAKEMMAYHRSLSGRRKLNVRGCTIAVTATLRGAPPHLSRLVLPSCSACTALALHLPLWGLPPRLNTLSHPLPPEAGGPAIVPRRCGSSCAARA